MGRNGQTGPDALRRRIAELEARVAELEAAGDMQFELSPSSEPARMLRLVLDAIPVRVFWKNRQGRYLGCNTLFARDAGLEKPEQLLGKDDYSMGWRDQADLYRSDDRAVMDSGKEKLNYEEPQTTPSGETLWLRTSKIPLRDANGEVIGILGTYEDITAQKRFAEQSAHRDRLEAIGRLAGGVAHDFNNMLTAILGGLALLQPAASENPDYADPLDTIHAASERAIGLTRQLLAFGRRQLIQPETIDPNEHIRRVQRLLIRILSEQIVVKTDLADGAWPVRIDPGQLEQCLVNIALNARDAMPDGGTLTFRTRNITDHYGPRGSESDGESKAFLEIAVIDTGTGIPSEVQAHVFEPFFTTKDSASGTGLGLATCHGIVEQNGGEIGFKSVPGVGTSFEIRLPRATDSVVKAEVPEEINSTQMNGTETVLVLEDEPVVRHVCVMTLQKYGYDVLDAATGEEAIEIATRIERSIDAIICDVVLPDTSGPAIVDRLTELHPAVRALYVSGYTKDLIVQDGVLEPGINFVQKPYTPTQIVQALRQLLGHQAGPE